MDLGYLRAHPQHLPTFLTHQRIRETPVPGGSVAGASRLTLDDGNSIFAKTWPGGPAPDGFFAAEANGLRWLREADAVPVPVIASGGVGTLDHLVAGIRDGHATAVLAASIFHFGEYTVRQAKEHMARSGLPAWIKASAIPSVSMGYSASFTHQASRAEKPSAALVYNEKFLGHSPATEVCRWEGACRPLNLFRRQQG